MSIRPKEMDQARMQVMGARDLVERALRRMEGWKDYHELREQWRTIHAKLEELEQLMRGV